GFAPWLSPVRSPSSPAARAAAATSIRLRACSSGAYAPMGRSMKAPFGIAATRLRNRSWVAGEVGKRKRTEVPSFMGPQGSMPLDAAASSGRSSGAPSDPAPPEEARDEERLQGHGLGPAHDGARRALGALPRRAVQ